jgi:hypothetical protein
MGLNTKSERSEESRDEIGRYGKSEEKYTVTGNDVEAGIAIKVR